MKQFSVVTIIVSTILLFTCNLHAAEETITNAQFAELLVRVLGTAVPEGSEELPGDQYYEVLVNALAATGITNLVDTDPAGYVTCARFIDTIYPIVGGTQSLDIEGKREFLVATIDMPDYALNDNMIFSEAAAILNNPNFAPLVAEGYRGIAFGSESGLAPGFTLEDTASQS